MKINIVLILLICFMCNTYLVAQECQDKNVLRIFLDCHDNINTDYIKTEMPFVNYVIDRMDANVHILITSQSAGGGRKYSIDFIGLQNFEGKNETLNYVSGKTDTADEIRSRLIKTIKAGIVYYIAQTPLCNNINVECRQEENQKEVKDKWNNWVFTINTSGSMDGDNTTKNSSVSGYVRANRVTEEWKIINELGGKQSIIKYDIDDREVKSIKNSSWFDSMIVKSLTEHWSSGGYLNYVQTTYENKKIGIKIAPAIEYNIFPYREYNRKQFSILYKVTWNSVEYYEETLYNKLAETLWSENLSVSFSIKQPWGSLYSSLQGSHYFHDFDKRRLTIDSEVDIRIFKGFSIGIDGSYSIIHDQLSLTKGKATEEEILLTQKERATTYDYDLSLSLRFTFGSIYSDVVNPRFGD